MHYNEYADFAAMRADLLHDWEPETAQERLLVNEVAYSWKRLAAYRDREFKFFDLQKHAEAVRTGMDPQERRKTEGAEVTMWLDKPHKALDQIISAIREAGLAFDRAVRRIEDVKERRLKRERQARLDQDKRDKEREKTIRQAHKAAKTATAQAARREEARQLPVEIPAVRRPDLSRAPDNTKQTA